MRYRYTGADSLLLTGTEGHGINSAAFCRSALGTACIGSDEDGIPVLLDLNDAPHVLIGGTTGSGKSVLLHDIILSLMLKGTPFDTQFVLVDTKIVEFNCYRNSPFLRLPIVTESADIVGALNQIIAIMQDRLRVMASQDLRQWKGASLYIVIDELADALMVSGKTACIQLTRIAQKGRAAGIHLILATQQPSVRIMPSALKANCPTRIGLKVKSITDSRIILDHKGAEALKGKGDGILSSADGSEKRFQAGYLSMGEIKNVLDNSVIEAVK